MFSPTKAQAKRLCHRFPYDSLLVAVFIDRFQLTHLIHINQFLIYVFMVLI